MPMDRGTPDLVRHCVAAVAKQYGGDTSKAFAICVAQLQKSGYLKPGTMELTAAGKKKEKEHEAEPDAAKKLKSYEKLLKANRKEEAADPKRKALVNFVWKNTHKDFRGSEGGKNVMVNDPKTGGTKLVYLDSLSDEELMAMAAKKGFKESTSRYDFFEALMNPRERSGFEGVPTTVSRRYESVSHSESPMTAMRRLAGISEAAKYDADVSRDIGERIQRAIAGWRDEIEDLKQKIEDANAAWQEQDWDYLRNVGVLSVRDVQTLKGKR